MPIHIFERHVEFYWDFGTATHLKKIGSLIRDGVLRTCAYVIRARAEDKKVPRGTTPFPFSIIPSSSCRSDTGSVLVVLYIHCSACPVWFRLTMMFTRLLACLFLAVTSLQTFVSADSIPAKLVTQARRILNFGSTFGSPTSSKSPYDRVMGHPVFQVTTPYGAPYMNFEKVDTADADLKASADVMGPESESRPVTLFYMDYEDAIQMHEEMKQMGNMQHADIRITTTSLAKAIRQSSNFGNGLVTGSPIDPLTGNLKSPNEGGSLRYKIVPPKRQLFYASRCQGKERVGLFGTAQDESQTFVENNQFVHNVNLERRRDAKERRTNSGLTKAQLANKHMEGYTGIPVFYCPQLKRVHPLPKRLLGGKEEKPFFFSYEDLQEAWTHMRKRNKKIPPQPQTVEVFNLMDVLTSMERQEWKQSHPFWRNPVKSVKSALQVRTKKSELHDITFVPPKRCVQYKEKISAQGNGKARLRPMR